MAGRRDDGVQGDSVIKMSRGAARALDAKEAPRHPDAAPPRHRAILSAGQGQRLVAWSLLGGFLALYALTAAPSVLSGDAAEFQLAAALLGVPHPTTYPLYTVLGHLATRLIPLGEVAWRVTLLSALCAALAVALFYALARRILGATPAALVGALALGLAPGMWNAATLAEVYALLALLIVAMALAVVGREMPHADGRAGGETNGRAVSPSVGTPRRDVSTRLYLGALIGGLGFSHHGLFAITALPLLAAAVVAALLRGPAAGRPGGWPAVAGRLLLLALCFLAGLAPWLYPPLQFARYGPFNGLDYGLPTHYFWGAPQSYGEVLDLMTGGAIRRGIFRLPEPGDALAVLRMVGRRLLFEFGPVGAALGLLGAWELARSARWMWRGAAWIFFSTLASLLLLGPAVGDAPVFTLPMLLPWALWIGAGAAAILSWSRRLPARLGISQWPAIGRRWPAVALVVLLGLTLAWGATRYRVSSKRHLWLYREFAEATLAELPRGAAVLAPWEQGMTLQYLRLVEGQRPDVWVDVVEPGDEPWGPRAARRYPDRPVYFVGPAEAVAGLPVELVREDPYALLFRLR